MQYMLLVGAILSEVFGTTMMKASEGFQKKLPTLELVIGYTLSFALLGFALRDLPLGLAYGIWGGIGTALTAVAGAIFWKESMSAKKIVAILLVIAGIVVLEMGNAA